jgi:hypothetical protein
MRTIETTATITAEGLLTYQETPDPKLILF